MGSGKKDHYKGSEEERARSCSIRFIQRMVNEFKTEIKLFKKYKKQVKKNGTPIVYYSFSLFYLLELIFCGFMDWMRKHWVCWRIKRKEKKGEKITSNDEHLIGARFIDYLVLINLVIAFAWMFLLPRLPHNRWFWGAIGVFSVFRILQMFVYQVNVLFFHPLKKMETNTSEREDQEKKEEGKAQNSKEEADQKSKLQKENREANGEEGYVVVSTTRTVLLLLLNIVEYIVRFYVLAFVWSHLTCNFSACNPPSGWEMFEWFMNGGDLAALSQRTASYVLYSARIVGIFMNILCLARFLGAFPELREMKK